LGGRAVCALARKIREAALDVGHYPAEGDPEDSLAAREQVDDLARRGQLVDSAAVGEQRDLREVGNAALAQRLNGGPDVLQRDPGVEQPLDHLEHEDVAERVETLGAGPGGPADG